MLTQTEIETRQIIKKAETKVSPISLTEDLLLDYLVDAAIESIINDPLKKNSVNPILINEQNG